MTDHLIVVLIAAAVVIAGTFILRTLLASALKIIGLAVVAFLARREDLDQTGFDWMVPYDLVIIVGAAIFGWILGAVMNLFFFRKDGFGKHIFSPLIAVAFTYVAALLIEL